MVSTIVKTISPFVVTSLVAAVYISIIQTDFTATTAIVKIFPIVYLVALVNASIEADFSAIWCKINVKNNPHAAKRNYMATNIMYGLIASAIGDAFLIAHDNPNYFLFGVLAFGTAQFLYIRGIGFQKIRWSVGLLTYLLGALILLVVSGENLQQSKVLEILVPIYGFLLLTMSWRAADRAHVEDGREPLQRRLLRLGGLLFVFSDACLATTKRFFPNSYNECHIIIMVSYYAAQGCLALGVA